MTEHFRSIPPPRASLGADLENKTVRKDRGKLGRNIETRRTQFQAPVAGTAAHSLPFESLSAAPYAPFEPSFADRIPTQTMNRKCIQKFIGEQDSPNPIL